MEEVEASLKGIPANISPISTAYSSSSASPSVDPTELQTDANIAADHMLHMKRSTDLKRKWVIWVLGLLLHQSEVEEAASVKKAKVVHSWEVLDTKVDCTKSVQRPNATIGWPSKKPKQLGQSAPEIWDYLFYGHQGGHGPEIFQSVVLHREHIRLMQELEEQALREESKSHHDFLSTSQAALHHAPQPLKENLATSCHVLLGQLPPSPPSDPPTRASLAEEQPPAATSPMPAPKQFRWPKRQHPSPELQGSMSIDETTPRVRQEGSSSPKRWKAPTRFTSLKPSHAVAFLWDSSIVKEARSCFFSNHSYIFVNDGTSDLSDVFKELAKSTGLLGEAIYKIQLSETRPEELK